MLLHYGDCRNIQNRVDMSLLVLSFVFLTVMAHTFAAQNSL